MSKRIESFRDLNVYQLAFQLQQEIFEIIGVQNDIPSPSRLGEALWRSLVG